MDRSRLADHLATLGIHRQYEVFRNSLPDRRARRGLLAAGRAGLPRELKAAIAVYAAFAFAADSVRERESSSAHAAT